MSESRYHLATEYKRGGETRKADFAAKQSRSETVNVGKTDFAAKQITSETVNFGKTDLAER